MGNKTVPSNRKSRRTAVKQASKKTTAEQPIDDLRQQEEMSSGPENLATDSESEADNAADSKKQKSPSKAKLSIERIKEVKAALIAAGKNPSQRNIVKAIGGSYSTASRLMQQIERLENDPIDVSVTVSDATREAIAADIMCHLEQFQASVKYKLDSIESFKEELRNALETINEQQQTIAEQQEEINKLLAINKELLKLIELLKIPEKE